jgi:Ca2+-binding RTX toxin-like protein
VRPSRLTWAILAAAAAMLLVPSLAAAAHVEVVEGPEPRTTTLLFVGGEVAETVTATLASETEEGFTAAISDADAPLEVGPGCTGGGAAGTVALCPIPKPRLEVPDCGGHCWAPPYDSKMRFELGGGNDVLEVGRFDKRETYVIAVYGMGEPTEVLGGPGEDTITTGPAGDVIDPGPGNDIVHGGTGNNTVIADPAPDGNDLLDFGEHPAGNDVIDFAARTEPIRLSGDSVGAAGETDTLIGAGEVIGGFGDDRLIASGRISFLFGGPGNDTLKGTPGGDYLLGGPGDDRLFGFGGGDHVFGGPGNDRLAGGAGNDRLIDVDGQNTVLGGSGKNTCHVRRGDTVRDCQEVVFLRKKK